MVAEPMNVGAVDIGTNTVRLLITDGVHEAGRWVEVTGLGRGVDATGELGGEAIDRTIQVLAGFGHLMDRYGVADRRAVATSASRDATNREELFDRAETALGVRPVLISGDEEARLGYEGAAGAVGSETAYTVCDIGGGSTEFVSSETSISVDIGSVRLSDRCLPVRPARPGHLAAARHVVAGLFERVEIERVGQVVGVAGTWTSLCAISLDLSEYDRESVHRSMLGASAVEGLVVRLAAMTAEETAAIPSLDPKRAPVILAGALIASAVYETLGVGEVVVSESDTLDAVAARLLAIR